MVETRTGNDVDRIEDVFTFVIDNREPLYASDLAYLLLAIDELAKSYEHYGPTASVRVIDLRIGSTIFGIEVTANRTGAAAGVASAFIAALALLFQDPDPTLGDQIGGLIDRGDVRSVTVQTDDKTITVVRHSQEARPDRQQATSAEIYRENLLQPKWYSADEKAVLTSTGHFLQRDDRTFFFRTSNGRDLSVSSGFPVSNVNLGQTVRVTGIVSNDGVGQKIEVTSIRTF